MKNRLTALGIIAAFLTCCSVPALAEEKESKTVQQLDAMVVTATQTENTILKTASNIAVFTADDIKNGNTKNVADLLRKLPGVFYTNASGLEPKISFRGTHIGMSPGAEVILNGIPVSLGKFGYTDFEAIPIENIERIEVIKGPMSSLYGGNSARGVINIMTKRGKNDFGGSLSAIAGSNNDQRTSVLIHGGKDKWDYNLNVKKRDEDGYRDETWLDNFYVNGELGYWLSDDTRIGAYVNVADKERSLAKKLTAAQKEENPTQATDYSLTENQDLITGLNLSMKKSAFDLSTSLYYKNRDKTYENYPMASSTPYLEDLNEDVFGMRSVLTFKQDLFNRGNKFSMGFDYDKNDIDLKTTKATSKTVGAPYTKPYPKQSGNFASDIIGVFIQDEFSILDNLTVTAGLRYDYFEFDNNADYDFSEDGKYDYNGEPDYDKFNPKLSISYQPTDSLSLYTSFSKSYRAPSIYDYYASGSYSAKNAFVLEPETFTQYEIGLRHQVGKWLAVDAAIYHLTMDDMMDSAYSDSGKYMGKQNIGKAVIQGFELTLSGKPCDRFSYAVSYTYTDSKYAEDIFAKNGENINGNEINKVPSNKLNIDLETSLVKLAAHELIWNVSLLAQDEFAMDNLNSSYYSGYALVNTKLTLEHESYEFFIAVDNILDKAYDGYAYTSSGKDYYYPADGTTFAVGVEYKF
ncbi:MAG: TonB-dependent receptor [Desulfobacterium sp.]|nr:TonB-dependent receptor [Desulfobacterium sp.]